MTNTSYFKIKAAGKRINQNIKAKHPEYSSKKVYALTKSILAKQFAAETK